LTLVEIESKQYDQSLDLADGYSLKRRQISKHYDQDDTDQTKGTWAYFSPESVRVGSLGLRYRSDLSAWTIVAHSIIDGHRGKGLGRKAIPALADYYHQAICSNVEKKTNEVARKMWAAIVNREESGLFFRDPLT